MCMWTQNPEDPGRQIYGAMLEMEIIFELEDYDLDCVFTPDFRMQTNTSDETQVSWGLPNSKSQGNVVLLFPEFSDQSTVYPITPDGTDV